MVQSSNYKQFNRSTRILTEESGFASGMLWTGNNIDELAQSIFEKAKILEQTKV